MAANKKSVIVPFGEKRGPGDKNLPRLDAVDWRIPGRLMREVVRIIGDEKPDIEAAVKKAFDENSGVTASDIVKAVRAARAKGTAR